MTNEEFNIEIENSTNRSKRLLMKKGLEYSTVGGDRLEQFYRAGAALKTTPHTALIGMVAKHFTSLADMGKHPFDFKVEKWNEKITDIRNYTYLLDALVRDFETHREENN